MLGYRIPIGGLIEIYNRNDKTGKACCCQKRASES
jgi:hypothetical protein